MELCRTINLEWNDGAAYKIKEYWRGRGIVMREVDVRRMIGRRGSLWGNLSSLHIARVMTTVTVTQTEGGIECVVRVDPRFRSVTALNRSYLELELSIFESYLLTGDLQPDAWAEHRRHAARTRAELATMSVRSLYRRRSPMVLGGDLRLKAWTMLFLAIVLSPTALLWGPKISRVLDILRGRPVSHLGAFLFGPILAIGLAAIYLILALLMFKVQRASATCVNARQAADHLGVQYELMQRILLDRKIQPRFIVDGEPVYAMEDISDASRLLRPAEAPDAERLLRPAVSTCSETGERLLRPAVCEEANDDCRIVR